MATALASLLVAAPAITMARPGDRRGGPGTAVVGGEPVPDGRYPFMAALLDTRRGDDGFEQQYCGGSLIDRNHVLTAAHCVDDVDQTRPRALRVAVGRTLLTSNQGELRGVERVRIHPRYRPRGSAYDVAVVTLDRPVTTIEPLLATNGSEALERAGRRVTVAGWGDLNRHPPFGPGAPSRYPDRLHQAGVPIVADDRCADAYGSDGAPGNEVHPALMLCAGNQGKDACFGDSGGPLFANTGDGFRQIGIVSYGNGCAARRYPTVYTQLSAPEIEGFIESASGG